MKSYKEYLLKYRKELKKDGIDVTKDGEIKPIIITDERAKSHLNIKWKTDYWKKPAKIAEKNTG